MAAEYLMAHGTDDVILCERGIRTFETYTRNTLDLSAIPVLKKLCHLPVIVDPSHATGIREKVAPHGAGRCCGWSGRSCGGGPSAPGVCSLRRPPIAVSRRFGGADGGHNGYLSCCGEGGSERASRKSPPRRQVVSPEWLRGTGGQISFAGAYGGSGTRLEQGRGWTRDNFREDGMYSSLPQSESLGEPGWTKGSGQGRSQEDTRGFDSPQVGRKFPFGRGSR